MYFRYLAVLFCVFGVTLAGVTEDQMYLESLAANIEKSGLLPNFAQAWREHIDSWNNFQANTTWPFNETWPSTWNGTWPTNGTTPTPGSFDCNTTYNYERGEYNINRIHPGRIDIVAAMGASMVAGTGAGATRLLETTLQYRGLSFPIGGDGAINDTLTVPNILKKIQFPSPRLVTKHLAGLVRRAGQPERGRTRRHSFRFGRSSQGDRETPGTMARIEGELEIDHDLHRNERFVRSVR
jgi:hypothetical protein